MELVRMGGTSSGDTTAVASTRPSASMVSTVCAPSTRRAAASKVASASAVDSIVGRGAAGVVDIVGKFYWPCNDEMGSAKSVASEALIVARSRQQASPGCARSGLIGHPDKYRTMAHPGCTAPFLLGARAAAGTKLGDTLARHFQTSPL